MHVALGGGRRNPDMGSLKLDESKIHDLKHETRFVKSAPRSLDHVLVLDMDWGCGSPGRVRT